jgi:hypothetical protein
LISYFFLGEDVKPFTQVPGGVNTDKITVTGLSMNQGDKYYSNVVAYNQAGLHSTETSDGVVIDITKPLKGYIDDGLGKSVEILSRIDPLQMAVHVLNKRHGRHIGHVS